MVYLEEVRPDSGRRHEQTKVAECPDTLDVAVNETLYCEPYGVPHKRIGDVILPAFLHAQSMGSLSDQWRITENDTLLAISPGLFPNIQVLEPLFALAGDPLPADASPGGPVEGACAFRQRMLEMETSQEELSRSGNRCLFTLLPPWLLPMNGTRRFGKTAVFLADPRYLILRQLKMWEIFKTCMAKKGISGCQGYGALDESEFLRAYLEQDCSLSGEEMQRLSRWAVEEHRQPGKVKIFFVEDFVAEPDVALRGLARFLGVPDESEVLHQAIKKLEGLRPHGLFFPRQDMLELQHFLTITMDFELRLAELPNKLQGVWQDRVSMWPQLPNLRLATLGQSLQRHKMWVAPIWWAAHSAEICKPCSFAPRGVCRAGDDCDFCHAPSHRAPLRRPSKKERMRRLRKSMREAAEAEAEEEEESLTISTSPSTASSEFAKVKLGARSRTPSPGGLSS